MSSRAKGRADHAREAEGESRALPFLWRATLLCALVLLIVYTASTALKLSHPPIPSAPAPILKTQADILAARTEAALALTKAGLKAGAERLAAHSDQPLDAVEVALAIGEPWAQGGAVVASDTLVAAKGADQGAAWRQAGVTARAAGLAPGQSWSGVIQGREAHDGPATLYLASPLIGPKGLQLVMAVNLSAMIPQAPVEHDIALVSADGAILAYGGAPNAKGASLKSRFGTDGSNLRGLFSADVGKGQDTAGNPLHIAAAATSDPNVIALASEPLPAPTGAPTRRMADQLFTLLAPLAAGLLLTLILVRQTRKANEAREARTESERKFRIAVEAARCGIWEWRMDDDMMTMSDVTGAMLGWGGGGAARGVDVLDRISTEHRERVRQALRGAAEFGGFDVSFRVEHASGAGAWIAARGQGFEPGPNGFRVVIGVALDVTDERTAELRAQQAERRLSDAIDSVSEAFVLWSRQGRLIMCNRNFREFFSLEARLLKPGASKDKVEKFAELALKPRDPAAEPATAGEVELNDGRWLQISERRTADGGWVMTASDITALKSQEAALRRKEEALQSAVQRLEESSAALAELAEKHQAASASAESASRAKSEFLANMSHELRTPLNAINGFSEIMAREMFGPLGEKRYKDYAGDILASGQHLLALINDILDMSKIEAGKMNMHPEPLDFAEIADDAMRLLRTRAEGAGLTMTADIPEDLPEVEADYRAIKQILLNLISNAVKFTPRGGKVRVFAARMPEDAGHLRIGVVDTGIGIAEDDMGRLARPFEQIENQHSKTQQGSGLGLALTKSLVEMHGGRLDIQSQPGVGTNVSFTLKIAAAKTGRASVAA